MLGVVVQPSSRPTSAGGDNKLEAWVGFHSKLQLTGLGGSGRSGRSRLLAFCPQVSLKCFHRTGIRREQEEEGTPFCQSGRPNSLPPPWLSWVTGGGELGLVKISLFPAPQEPQEPGPSSLQTLPRVSPLPSQSVLFGSPHHASDGWSESLEGCQIYFQINQLFLSEMGCVCIKHLDKLCLAPGLGLQKRRGRGVQVILFYVRWTSWWHFWINHGLLNKPRLAELS